MVIILSALLLLYACNAKSDPQTEAPADTLAVADSLAADSLAVTPLVTFIELGAATCIPCKMMQPVMKEIAAEYQGLVKVVFYDLYKEREAGQKYGVRVMPTQVFLDHDGKEFFRHEGFYPQAEIEKMLAEKAGVTKPDLTD
jgi:thioredoxin 1